MTKGALTATVLAAAVVSLGAVGCTQHQTEMILVITTEGVRIPDDVQKLHLKVADREASLDDTVYESDVNLCNPELTTSCYDIPVTGVLFPGGKHGSDSVRVEVDAIGPGGTVIADAALFTFAKHQSLRLDFVLYANCLGNVTCAERDQACGPLDNCITLAPGPTSGPLDLALPPAPADMSMPEDMTLVDLANADLTHVPPDLTSTLDMAGCASVTCDMGEVCIAGQCVACGELDEPCCFTGGSAGTGGMCNQTNLACNGSLCIHCGNDGELCCPNMVPSCLAPDNCVANMCMMPPPSDMLISTGGQDMFISIGGDMMMAKGGKSP